MIKEGCDRGSEVEIVHSGRDKEGPVPLMQPKESGSRENCEISSPGSISGVSYLCNDQSQWAGNMNQRKCCSGFSERVFQFITEKSSVTRDPLGSLELREIRESQRGPKYLRRILVGETPEPLKEEQGPIRSQLVNGPIESGISCTSARDVLRWIESGIS